MVEALLQKTIVKKDKVVILLGMIEGLKNSLCFFSILNRLLFLIIQYLWKIDNKNYQMSFFSETLYLVTFYAKKCVPIQSLRMLLKFNQSRFTDKFYLKF